MRASNIAWETPEGRSFFKLRPLQILVTLAMVIMLALVALALVLTGPVVDAVGGAIGVGDTALEIWDIAKWPVLLGVVILMFSAIVPTPPVKTLIASLIAASMMPVGMLLARARRSCP